MRRNDRNFGEKLPEANAMIRLGATGSQAHLVLCRALETVFVRRGIDFDWVLYSGYDQMVEAFVRGDINLAWNGPLSHVKMRRAFPDGAPVVALRDVDVDFTTVFVARADSDINTVEDLPGLRFAFGARSSVQAGLLPVHFLKEMGIHPNRDLACAEFFDQRQSGNTSDELDVLHRVLAREYDAGAVSGRVLDSIKPGDGIETGALKVFWTSAGYSHCCFTARPDLHPQDASEVTAALVAVDASDPAGKAVLEAENCDSLIPGKDDGWDIVEAAALAEGLI